jgi:hypothetical protein
MVIVSCYKQEIDMNTNGAKQLYKEGSDKLPTKFSGKVRGFRLFINDVTSCATECKEWDSLILE